MQKFFVLALGMLLSFSLTAQEKANERRPWRSDWRAAHADRMARLRSDSVYLIVRQGTLAAELEDRKGEKHEFEALIERLRGRIVVVDLWNRGCPPCLESLPAMYALMKEFEQEPVSFVYLNTGNRRDEWKNFVASGQLGEAPYNFRVYNSSSAPLLKTLGYSIPRYLLIDRQGRLCNAAAPSPDKGLSGYIWNLLKDDQFEDQSQ